MNSDAAARLLEAVPGLRRAADLGADAPSRVVEQPRHIVPVTADIAALLPYGGLATVTALAAAPTGSTSLLWRVLAGPTSAGAWAAIVGIPGLYPLAARAAGVDLNHLALVEAEGPRAVDAAGVLASGVAVLVVPSDVFSPVRMRRLAAKARRSGTALLWWQTRAVHGADAHLAVQAARWQGLRPNTGRRYGSGRLDACELDVLARWRTGGRHRACIWPYGHHCGDIIGSLQR